MRRLFRLAVLMLVPLAALLASTLPAGAHPMGNFSINHYAGLTVGRDALRLLYIVDMAEIPTFQELGDLNPAHSANLSSSQRAAYLASRSRALASGLDVRFDGRPLRLTLRAADLLFPPGSGGLPTERIYLVLQAPLPRHAGTVSYQDNNFPARAGWKEIVATAGDGFTLNHSTVPVTSRSAALTLYPSNATSSPPQDLAAMLTLAPAPLSGGAASAPARLSLALSPFALIRQAEAPLRGPGGAWSTLAQRLAVKGPAASSVSWAQSRMDALSALIARRDLTPAVLIISLLIATVLGAFHAFSPGHGKTVVAAYIVGSRATAWHAALLGLTVTVTHTAGVFALGLVTLGLSHYIVPDKLYPWLGALSGLGITAIGITLALRRLRALRHPRQRDTSSHVHGHGLPHEHMHAHEHDLAHQYAHEHNLPHEHLHAHEGGTPHVHLPDGRVIEPALTHGHDHSHEESHYAAVGR